METDAFVGLARLALCHDHTTANLARVALKLAIGLREAEARAANAELALRDTQDKHAKLQRAALRALDTFQSGRRSITVTRETRVVLEGL